MAASRWFTLLQWLADGLGSWFFDAVARSVAAFFFCWPPRSAASRRLYRLLYPDRSPLYHWYCAFRQFQNFTTIHTDRYRTRKGQTPQFTSAATDALDAAIGSTGAVVLMAHLGNWEMAAHLLVRDRQQMQLLLYMGIKEKEGLEGAQKELLRQAGVRIIAVDQQESQPLSAIEGITLLRQGGVVSLPGDIVWQAGQRYRKVRFLGRQARIAEAPLVLALVTGAPVFIFFAFRTGTNRYHFTISDPLYVQAASRQQRHQALDAAAQQYADLLEAALRAHPLEWYHFRDFTEIPPSS